MHWLSLNIRAALDVPPFLVKFYWQPDKSIETNNKGATGCYFSFVDRMTWKITLKNYSKISFWTLFTQCCLKIGAIFAKASSKIFENVLNAPLGDGLTSFHWISSFTVTYLMFYIYDIAETLFLKWLQFIYWKNPLPYYI